MWPYARNRNANGSTDSGDWLLAAPASPLRLEAGPDFLVPQRLAAGRAALSPGTNVTQDREVPGSPLVGVPYAADIGRSRKTGVRCGF